MTGSILDCCGIYAIRNRNNGKLYVGSALNVKDRWRAHLHRLRKGKHHSPRLQASWNVHGEDAFFVELLEAVSKPEDLISREQYFIDSLCSYVSGYNACRNAGSRLGMSHTPEAKEKIAAFFRGKPKARSLIQKGEKLSAAHVAKVAAANRGKKRTAETRAKISAAAKGNTRWLGKKHTDEAKAKVSAANKGRVMPPRAPVTDQAKAAISRANSRPVIVDGVTYPSFRLAAEAVGCHKSNISLWVKSGRAILAA